MRDDNGDYIEDDDFGPYVRYVAGLEGPQDAKNMLLSDLISSAQRARSGMSDAEPEPMAMPEVRLSIPVDEYRTIMCEAGIHRIYRYDTCALCEANGY